MRARDEVRLIVGAFFVLMQLFMIYLALSFIGGPLLAVPVVVFLGMIKRTKDRLVRNAEKVSWKIVKRRDPAQ